MSNRKDDTFIVKAENAFFALPKWLKKRGCNTYSFSDHKTINVGYDTRPDSDWGGKYTWLGRIVVLDPALFEKTQVAIRKAYGWKSADQAEADALGTHEQFDEPAASP